MGKLRSELDKLEETGEEIKSLSLREIESLLRLSFNLLIYVPIMHREECVGDMPETVSKFVVKNALDQLPSHNEMLVKALRSGLLKGEDQEAPGTI